MEEMTIAMQNYLELIYELSLDGKKARVSDIAKRLGVSKPSVNNAVVVLSKNGYVNYEKYSDIKFHIHSGNAEDVTEKLDKGLIDFGILIQPIDLSKYDYITMPAKDTWGVIMRKDSSLAEKEHILIEELTEIPLIVSRQGATNEMPEWLQKNYDRLTVIATYDLIFNASILVKEGLGYALGLDKLINTGEESPLCFRPVYPAISSPLRLIWRKDHQFSHAASLYLDKVKTMCR